MDINASEEKHARLRREGMVDALVDCLALLQRDGLRRVIQGRVADASSIDGNPVCGGAYDGYLACQQWVAHGIDGDTLAARIVQRVFAVWPRDAADYQLRYDKFLEMELENPRATYYLSSREWIAAVDDLRDEVARACELGQAPSDKAVRRCLKLLLTHASDRPLPPRAVSPNLFPTLPSDIGGAQQPCLIK